MKKETKQISRFFCALMLALFLFIQPAMAQPPYWKLNGNPNFGPDVVNAGNNFFGTSAVNNIAVRLGTAGVSRIFMQNNTAPFAGFVGIGAGFITPNQLLTVNGGNINVNTATNGYMIGNVMTMWRGQNGIISNIFVGANAGAANTVGANNTFIGNNAGANNTTAVRNTYVGSNAGSAATTIIAFDNTFMGTNSGLNNV